MTHGSAISLFALDCGATHWRLYRAGYRLEGNALRILGDPQPAPLTSFSDRVLPAVFSLDPAGGQLDQIGEPALAQLEVETLRQQVCEYFKPCIGAHLETDPLPHQTRYSHKQALEFTRLLLAAILHQIQQEKWRGSPFDDRIRFAFSYPVHWQYAHGGQVLADFKAIVLACFPEKVRCYVRFVPEPEGAILSLQRQGLLNSAKAGPTLIVDVGGSTTDIVAGQVNTQTGELCYLGHYGQPFGGGLYDAAIAEFLSYELDLPPAELTADPAALATLRIYAQRLKEALSRQILQADGDSARQTAQRMITLVLPNGQVYRRMIQLNRAGFHQYAGHLDQKFKKLIAAALTALKIQPEAVGQVVLVGGGVQLFSIVAHLREVFGASKIVLADNPAEIVVRGVALEYGASLGTLEPGASLVLASPQTDAPLQGGAAPLTSEWVLVSAEGESHPLKPGSTKIGRARDCQIWLDSEKVSRNHAEIRVDADTISLTDLGSTNGTFLDAERLASNQPRPLTAGDELRFGDRKFILN